MSAATKTCKNCYHRSGSACVRTGFQWTTEMSHGGRCAGSELGTPEMNLWEPRHPTWMRVASIFSKQEQGK